jgi:hypothetical protein
MADGVATAAQRGCVTGLAAAALTKATWSVRLCPSIDWNLSCRPNGCGACAAIRSLFQCVKLFAMPS